MNHTEQSRPGPVLLALLRQRGIETEEDIAEFLSEKPEKTYDPFLMKGLSEGVDFLLSAAKEGKRICVYGDYDADGVTSVALMRSVLSHLTDRAEHYIPSRIEEGYGLNRDALRTLKERGVEVVVTVDCGSVSLEESVYAGELGLELMITDHHSVGSTVARGILINPRQPGCGYPFPWLAGVGVAFKLAQGLRIRAGLPKSVLTEVLDLVAVGTIGDVVPLTDENRTLVKHGLRLLNLRRRPGLAFLLNRISPGGPLDSEGIAFGVVPHINAAGRMETAETGVRLLTARRPETYETAAASLIESNLRRREVQEELFQRAVRQIEAGEGGGPEALCKIVLVEDAHEGVAGIVAGKLKDRYHSPAVVLTASRSGDRILLKGTGRSVEKVDLYLLLKECEPLFERFGGHAGACGFSMEKDRLPAFRETVLRRMEALTAESPELLVPVYKKDMELPGKEIGAELARQIDLMEPFGHRNERPVFSVRTAALERFARMGTEQQHARFEAVGEDGSRFSCVLFGKAEQYGPLLEAGGPAELLGTVSRSRWNGMERIQFVVEHLSALT